MPNRPARAGEVPTYGQAWSWDYGPPLMALIPAPEMKSGAWPIVDWVFMRLDDSYDQGALVRMSWFANGETLPEWSLVEDG